MSSPHDALARLRATADAAVEQGRRVVGEARESGAAFAEQARRLAEDHREGGVHHGVHHGVHQGDRPTSADLRVAAIEFRVRAGLPVPDPGDDEPAGRRRTAGPADDEDFSQNRIMRKL